MDAIHPQKVDQAGPAGTFTLNPTQLPTDHIWKDLIYSHYSLHTSTPILGVRAELGAFPTYIQGICRVSNYMAYLCHPECPPLVARAVKAQKAIAAQSKYSLWNNAWRLLNLYQITEENISPSASALKEDLQGKYRRWWMDHLHSSTTVPNWTHTDASTPPSIQLNISTKATPTSTRRLFAFAAQTTA